MIGDRLYTDMKMARSAGVLAVLTLTGETTEEQVAESALKPDLVIRKLGEFTDLIITSRTTAD
jgi:NagD protein